MKLTKKGDSFISRSQRVYQILMLVVGFLQIYARQQIASRAGANSKEKADINARELATWAKERFVALGPTFIKLGQIISTRADLFPRVWVEEFSTLQDKVDPFSFEQAKVVIESELEKPLEELFDWIDPAPLSVASIGQVHRVLRRIEGNIVEEVVKIQRPGVDELVNRDLLVLRSIVQHLIFLPRFTKDADLYGFLDELEQTFSNELDYRIEARNTEDFRSMFSDPAAGIDIPAVDSERSARKVLTLQYLPGTKLTRYVGSPDEMQTLAEILVKSFLKQFVTEGLFHADPHPGNIAVRKDAEGKVRIILYDFGMVGRLSADMRDSILLIAGAAFKGDAQGLISECVKAGILSESLQDDEDVLEVIERFISRLDKISAETIGTLQKELFNASESGGVNFPRELTLIGRSLISLEGDLRYLQTINPDLKLSNVVISEAMPLASKILGESTDPIERTKADAAKIRKASGSLLRQGRKLFDQIERGEINLPVTDELAARAVRRLRFGAKSVSAAVLFASFFVPGVLLFDLAHHRVSGIVLIVISIAFLERWYLAEKRMDS